MTNINTQTELSTRHPIEIAGLTVFECCEWRTWNWNREEKNLEKKVQKYVQPSSIADETHHCRLSNYDYDLFVKHLSSISLIIRNSQCRRRGYSHQSHCPFGSVQKPIYRIFTFTLRNLFLFSLKIEFQSIRRWMINQLNIKWHFMFTVSDDKPLGVNSTPSANGYMVAGTFSSNFIWFWLFCYRSEMLERYGRHEFERWNRTTSTDDKKSNMQIFT